MTEAEIRDEHAAILAGLTDAERKAVWRRALFGRERLDTRLLPIVDRLQDLRRRASRD